MWYRNLNSGIEHALKICQGKGQKNKNRKILVMESK